MPPVPLDVPDVPALTAPAAPAHEAPAVMPCRDGARFPGESWDSAAFDPPAAAVDALEAYAFPPLPDDPERPGVRTDAVVIVKDGVVVYERYARGYTPDSRHLAWSVSKTVDLALAGIAARDGRLSPADSICATHPDLPPEACAVRVADVLEMGSGFDWHETYEGGSPTQSSVLAMLYGEGHRDMAAFTAGHALAAPPGTTWRYSSGDSNILAGIVRAALEPAYGRRYPWAALFEPLGITSATWEGDGSGTPVGSSYLYATPRDLARFGLFLREDGCWAGKRVLPDDWLADATRVAPGFRHEAIGGDADDVQGRQVWLNLAVPEQGIATRPWPDVPSDAFAARGHWGQSITVVPSLDLVVVRTADDRDGSFSLDHFLALAAAVAEVGPPAPETPYRAPPRVRPAGPAPSSEPPEPQRYATSLLGLASAFAAKETCSCRYVLGRDDAFCRELTRVDPDVARARADDATRSVVARTLGFWPRRAHWISAQEGCTLDDRGR